MNRQGKANDFKNTMLYKGGSAFNLGEAAQVTKIVSSEMLIKLEAMVEAGDLHVVSEFLWAKPSRGLPFHWRKHPIWPFEAENRQCLVLS